MLQLAILPVQSQGLVTRHWVMGDSARNLVHYKRGAKTATLGMELGMRG